MVFNKTESEIVYVTFENAAKEEFVYALGDDSVAEVKIGEWNGNTVSIVITPKEDGETWLEVGKKDGYNYEYISITTALPKLEIADEGPVYVNGDCRVCYLYVSNFETNVDPKVLIADRTVVRYELQGWVSENEYAIAFYPLSDGTTTAVISLDGIEQSLGIEINSDIYEMYLEEDTYVLGVGEWRFITVKLKDVGLEDASYTCKSSDASIANCSSEYIYGNGAEFIINAYSTGSVTIEILADSYCSISFTVTVVE